MSIKKVYTDVYDLLEQNKNKKVETLMPQLLEIMSSKQLAKNFKVDDDGNVTDIFCYYHKVWEPVKWYGKKKHSPSGFNSMCKIGVNQWTKQQRVFKKSEQDLLDHIVDGTLSVDDIQSEREKLAELKKIIVKRPEDKVETE